MDDAIIQHVLEGDIESFRHLVSKYKNHSYNLAISIVKNELTAEEAVQDAFVKAYQNLHKFKRKSAFSTWLYRIVVNEALRKIKRRKLDMDSLSDFKEINSEIRIDPAVIEDLNQQDQAEFVQKILSQLSGNQSLVLKLYYLEEQSIEEISQITGLSTSNVKISLHRARKNFAEKYHAVLNTQI